MRVVLPLELRRLAQQVVRNRLRHLQRLDPARHLHEHVRHATLEVQPVIEDHVRAAEFREVPLRRFVQVRVHARPHQSRHDDMTAAHHRRNVRDHPDRRRHLDRAVAALNGQPARDCGAVASCRDDRRKRGRNETNDTHRIWLLIAPGVPGDGAD
jgi:hypothetical protein